MESLKPRIAATLNPIDEFLPDSIDLTTSAAVLILFVKVKEQWNIIFTKRTNGVKTHQGEVSFPGGAWEKSDTNLAKTALRETREEIGVDESLVRLLGGLDPHLTVYGHTVFPFVGMLDSVPDFFVNSQEVERVFLIPLEWLLDKSNYYTRDHVLFGKKVKKVLHYKDYDGEHLWGLTARITQDIIARI